MSNMAKFRVDISRVEYYKHAVIVEANSIKDALKKIEEAWEEREDLYEIVTDCMYDADTNFDITLATEGDLKTCTKI